MDVGNLCGIVLCLCSKLGFVGCKRHELGQAGHLVAKALVGDSLGLITTLGNNGGGEEKGDEEAGKLHVGGFEVEEQMYKKVFLLKR